MVVVAEVYDTQIARVRAGQQVPCTVFDQADALGEGRPLVRQPPGRVEDDVGARRRPAGLPRGEEGLPFGPAKHFRSRESRWRLVWLMGRRRRG